MAIISQDGAKKGQAAECLCVSHDDSGALRIGILGGTFDPPHNGHLLVAEAAHVQLQLDRVVLVLAGRPPHKPDRRAASDQHREAMVRAAIAGNPSLVLSRVDLDRSGPHYTVDMLRILRRETPEAELFFLMGEDSLVDFLGWLDPIGIVRQARLAVVHRHGYAPDLAALDKAIPHIRERLVWLDCAGTDIASTDLRQRVREGRPLDGLVPPSVEAYILDHGLYSGEPR